MKKHFTPPLKKFNLSLIFGIAVVLLLINSCRKENDSNELDQTKTELEQWYKEKVGKSASSPFSNLQPNWQKIYTNKQQKETVYEIELSNPKALIIKFGNADMKTQQEHSNVRLLIFKDDLTGNIKYGAYMYINHENETNPKQLHYKKLTNLTGRVVFYNLNGTMANGWIYKDGKAIAQTTPDESLNLNGKANSAAKGKVMNEGNTSCGYELMDTFFMVCGSVPSTGFISCNLQYYGKTNVMVCTTDNFGGNQQTIDHIAEEGLGGYVLKLDCKGRPGGDAINVLGCGCVFPEEVETACAPREIINSVKNPCLKSQVDSAINAKTSISNMLKTEFGGTIQYEDYSLEFRDTTNLADGTDGEEQRLSGIAYEIRLNMNKLPYYSKEYITATIYHEILHAFMDLNFSKNNNGKYDISTGHEEMANKYIILMTGALRIHNPNIPAIEAWALAWGGLQETTLWDSLTDDQRNQIGAINSRHRNSSVNRLGTYCN
jgi:hypothetical protein